MPTRLNRSKKAKIKKTPRLIKRAKETKTNYERFRDQTLKDEGARFVYELERTRLLLAEQIISLRKRHNMSQVVLARRAKMNQPQIARLESGRENPQYETVARIFVAMGEKKIEIPVA